MKEKKLVIIDVTEKEESLKLRVRLSFNQTEQGESF